MKKLKKELTELIKIFGYWSDEVFELNSNLDYTLMTKLNNNVKR